MNDVGGARNCNINAIWFNCEKKKWDEIFPCELQARSWKDLYEIISKNFILREKMFNPFNMTKDMKGMEKMVKPALEKFMKESGFVKKEELDKAIERIESLEKRVS